jgi:hypothetical protein
MAQKSSSEMRKQNSGPVVGIAIGIIVVAIIFWFFKWWIIWSALRLFGINPPEWLKTNMEIRN